MRGPRWPGLAAAYVGAVVGAGFASGREVYAFFAVYGHHGLLGAALAAALFATLGGLALHRIALAGHRHYGELLRDVCGPRLGGALDWLSLAALLVGLAAVLAACGALAGLLLGWPRWAGAVAMALPLATLGLGGRQAYLGLNLGATPAIVLAAVYAGAHAAGRVVWTAELPGQVLPWPLAALLYVAYNLVLAVAGLCAASAPATSPTESAAGGIVGGLIIGVLCLSITTALLPHLTTASAAELPLATAVSATVWRTLLYPVLLLVALWTTGSASAAALGQRLRPAAPGLPTAAVTLCALPLAFIGLAPLVSAAYPAVGIAGLPLLAALLLRPFRRRPRPQ